ncbi:hypothetical protein OAS39_06970 [Pirellulales bacterium]|nr:hypothetical protein [Pirellulales bacterium]
MERFAAKFRDSGWHVDEVDIWRDSGYFISMKRNGDELLIVVCQFHGRRDRWILQIAPLKLPGPLKRFFGAMRSASPDSVHQVATDCHRILNTHGFTEFQWCWDNLADNRDCSPNPVASNIGQASSHADNTGNC